MCKVSRYQFGKINVCNFGFQVQLEMYILNISFQITIRGEFRALHTIHFLCVNEPLQKYIPFVKATF